MLVNDYLQDFEYRSPESNYYSEGLTIEDGGKHDVLGYYAQLVEIGDLMMALIAKDYTIDSVLPGAEAIFNLDCGSKNTVTQVDGDIVVKLVSVDASVLIKKTEELRETIKRFEFIEFPESLVPGDVESMDKMQSVLNTLQRLTRRNPVDYDYANVTVEGENKQAIADYEEAIGSAEIFLQGLLEKRPNYQMALILAKISRLMEEGCQYKNTNLFATQGSMTVLKVEGDFTLLKESAIALMSDLESWYQDTYGVEDEGVKDDENPAPTPLEDRPPVVAYYNTVGEYKSFSNLKENNYRVNTNDHSMYYHGTSYCEFGIHLYSSGKSVKVDKMIEFIIPKSEAACSVYDHYEAHYKWRRQCEVTMLKTRSRQKSDWYGYNYLGLQFSTGKNACVDTKYRSYDFNPYGLKNKVEKFPEEGMIKVTFTGCNFPGICLVQSHEIFRNYTGYRGNGTITGVILNVSDVRIENGNAVAYIKGVLPGLFNPGIGDLHIAYLGSHHAISDALPEAKVSLYSNAWSEPFFSTNYEIDKGVSVKPGKVDFLDLPNKTGFTVLQAHRDPKAPDDIINIGLKEVRGNGIHYRLVDLPEWKVRKKQAPISVLSIQVDY